MGDGDDSLLAALIGEELASVIFIRDYVELDFDGPRLSVYVWPRVAVGTDIRRISDPGYRDALCALIGHTVTSSTESGEVGLVIDFGPGSVEIKPRPSEVERPEIAMLRGFADGPEWMVWRPGEGPFGAQDCPSAAAERH
ncbi:hypothetical protein [Dactylosporangium sp. NPDC048998]|uniref:hypothetical protein n=1 Tax=Dactylosporangium sp. NPDC048998 TaxID=3363976 RepID=UPI003710B36D